MDDDEDRAEPIYKYCSIRFISAVSCIYNYLSYLFDTSPFSSDTIKLQNFLKEHVNFDFDQCKHTDPLIDAILEFFSNLVINTYCTKINRIILGKQGIDSSVGSDSVEKIALDIYRNRLRYKR